MSKLPPLSDGLAGKSSLASLYAALLLALAASALPFFVDDYRIFQFTLVLVFALALLGLNLITGYCGQISLGHGAFYAIGAYTCALLMGAGMPYWLTLPFCAVIGLLCGLLVAIPALRLEGLYLALATYSLAVVFPQLLKYKGFEAWTGGSHGITLTKPQAPAGLPLSDDQWLYLFVLAVALPMIWVARNVLKGRIGLTWVAIREHPTAATSMGINTAYFKSLCLGISAAYTSIAGGLGAIAVQFVAPDSFGVFLSLSFLVGIVVGGMASIPGALIGAVFIQFIPEVTDTVLQSAPWAIYGAILIVFLHVMPGGIAGMASHFTSFINKRRHRDQ